MAIPNEYRKEINRDDFFRRCCIADETCSGRTQIHHNLIFGGRKVEEIWAYLPLCVKHHEEADRKEIKRRLNAIMRERAGDEALKPYEKIKKI